MGLCGSGLPGFSVDCRLAADEPGLPSQTCAVPHGSGQQAAFGPASLLRDPRYWRLLLANFLWMSIYLLWPAWTTLFLTSRYHLTTEMANRLYAWIPPLGATAGALAGGWLSMVLIARGMR